MITDRGVFTIPLVRAGEEASRSTRQASLLDGRGLGVRAYVADEENALVRMLLPALERGDPAFRPLVLSGPVSAGKTLLAIALARYFEALHPDKKTLTLSAADFARDYADALETEDLAAFRRRFRQASLVVLDDLQHLANKRPAQEECRRILDTLANRQTPVIITLREAPGELVSLLPDLRSRLAGGLVVPLKWPGDAARRELIARYLGLQQAKLSPASIDRLAQSLPRSPAQLFGALARLVHLAQTERRPLDDSLADELLREQGSARRIEPKAIAAAVARQFGVTVTELKGPSRRQSIATARSIAMYLMRQLTGESYEQIGRFFGRRDHTTAMHNIQKAAERLRDDEPLRESVELLAAQLADS